MAVFFAQTPSNMTDHPSPPAPGKLLLVDDEANILSSLRRLLRQDGYQIVAETSPEQALVRLQAEPFDVIISDQRMPGMMGVEFLRRAKKTRPETMRIVLSGYTELESVTSAINEGAVYKFLTKPWDDQQLREQVAAAFRHKGLEDENRRMGEELKAANTRMQELNNRLAAMVHEQRRHLYRDETALQTLQNVLRLIPMPVLGCDDDNMVVFTNETAERLFNARSTPLLGSDIATLLPRLACHTLTGNGAAETRMDVNGHRMRVECKPLRDGRRTRGSLYLFFEETVP